MSESRVLVWWARVTPGAPDEASELARRAVAHVRGVDPADVVVGRRCPTCGSAAHGAPTTTGAHVSITRGTGVVAVAASLDSPVGIDLEHRRDELWPGFDEVALSPDEHAPTADGRLRAWVRKEAVLKASGLGLTLDPRRVTISAGQVVAAPPEVAACELHDMDPPGHLGAVAAPVGAAVVVREVRP
ncbi:4'-phosphopantetheinyl transferase family protein [Cellulomonas rhizosphaerae]|uniref:4'-phosphopantetheinyl transferase family protein n=1 Tax=Cellulomonas rhizosphaerae TaxID=2293719 RepID=UPI00131421E2|nr:4'-phosphopantetheinyl transferase superfamily protein [Cellulomonas rhizosphaerae]